MRSTSFTLGTSYTWLWHGCGLIVACSWEFSSLTENMWSVADAKNGVHESHEVLTLEVDVEYPGRIDHAQSSASLTANAKAAKKYPHMY